MRAAEARFAALGGYRADAIVADANGAAHEVYSSLGYEREEGHRRWLRLLR
jgi:hypothetical protein